MGASAGVLAAAAAKATQAARRQAVATARAICLQQHKYLSGDFSSSPGTYWLSICLARLLLDHCDIIFAFCQAVALHLPRPGWARWAQKTSRNETTALQCSLSTEQCVSLRTACPVWHTHRPSPSHKVFKIPWVGSTSKVTSQMAPADCTMQSDEAASVPCSPTSDRLHSRWGRHLA